MPELARFFGIIVYMNGRDHNPPHVHALYGDREALVSLDGAVLPGGCRAEPCPWPMNGSPSTAPNCWGTGNVRNSGNPCNPSSPWSDR